MKLIWPIVERLLQDRMEGGQVDRLRHQSRRPGGGVEALHGRRVGVGAHIDDGDRRGGLDLPRSVDTVHGPL